MKNYETPAAKALAALDPDIRSFLTAVVETGRDTFPGQEGLVRFHEGLKALEAVIAETREEVGI